MEVTKSAHDFSLLQGLALNRESAGMFLDHFYLNKTHVSVVI